MKYKLHFISKLSQNMEHVHLNHFLEKIRPLNLDQLIVDNLTDFYRKFLSGCVNLKCKELNIDYIIYRIFNWYKIRYPDNFFGNFIDVPFWNKIWYDACQINGLLPTQEDVIAYIYRTIDHMQTCEKMHFVPFFYPCYTPVQEWNICWKFTLYGGSLNKDNAYKFINYMNKCSLCGNHSRHFVYIHMIVDVYICRKHFDIYGDTNIKLFRLKTGTKSAYEE